MQATQVNQLKVSIPVLYNLPYLQIICVIHVYKKYKCIYMHSGVHLLFAPCIMISQYFRYKYEKYNCLCVIQIVFLYNCELN